MVHKTQTENAADAMYYADTPKYQPRLVVMRRYQGGR
jgi:hypothetical protein